MEATGGFEPPNRGFADLRLNRLATSPHKYLLFLVCHFGTVIKKTKYSIEFENTDPD
jgi:hypothetical protein